MWLLYTPGFLINHFVSLPLIVPTMNNSSQSPTESQDSIRVNSLSRILRPTVYCLIFTLGLVGNTFVLISLKRKRRRTANDWFILNLTMSDLFFIVCLSSDVYVDLATSPYNSFYCKGLRPLSTVLLSTSVFTMTAMALERHQVITNPLNPRMKQSRARLVIGGIWMLSLVLTLPLPIVTTAGVYECTEPGWPAHIYSTIYTVTLLVIQYLLPLTIITAAYIGIILYLRLEKASHQFLNSLNNNAFKAARKHNMQVVKAVLTVVIFFAVCMMPNHLAWLLLDPVIGKTSHHEIANQLLKFSPITTYLHSCANPIIYGTFMQYFRQEFKTLLTTCNLRCRQLGCVWRRRHDHRVSTSAQIKPNENYSYGDDNVFSTHSRRNEEGVTEKMENNDEFPSVMELHQNLSLEHDPSEIKDSRL